MRTATMPCVVSVLVLAACRSQPAPPGTTGDRAEPAPDLARLREILRPHAGHRFDLAAQGRGCHGDSSLGEYVELLVKNGGSAEEPNDVHRLTGGCGTAPEAGERMPIDPPVDAAYWFCRIDAYTSDPRGESPWHYELRLRIRRSDGEPDLGHLACPGTP
jgi:hypothetical protein